MLVLFQQKRDFQFLKLRALAEAKGQQAVQL